MTMKKKIMKKNVFGAGFSPWSFGQTTEQTPQPWPGARDRATGPSFMPLWALNRSAEISHTTAARCQVSSLWRSSVPLITFYFSCYCFFQSNNRCIKVSNISGLIVEKNAHSLLSTFFCHLPPYF